MTSLPRHWHAFLVPGKVTWRPLADDQIAKARVAPAVPGGKLIERDAVAHPFPGVLDAIPFHAGEESRFAGVMGIAQMRNAGEHREFSPVLVEVLQVTRALVPKSGCFGEKVGCMQPEVAPDEEQTLGRRDRCGAGAAWQHGFERRQRETHRTSAEKMPAMDRRAEIQVWRVHLLRKGRDSTTAWMRLRRPKFFERTSATMAARSSRSANCTGAPVA